MESKISPYFRHHNAGADWLLNTTVSETVLGHLRMVREY